MSDKIDPHGRLIVHFDTSSHNLPTGCVIVLAAALRESEKRSLPSASVIITLYGTMKNKTFIENWLIEAGWPRENIVRSPVRVNLWQNFAKLVQQPSTTHTIVVPIWLPRRLARWLLEDALKQQKSKADAAHVNLVQAGSFRTALRWLKKHRKVSENQPASPLPLLIE